MQNLEYTMSWSYMIQNEGGASNTGPVHSVKLSTVLWPTTSINDADVEANAVLGAITSYLVNHAAGGEEGPASFLDGVRRHWVLGQVGEVGQ